MAEKIIGRTDHTVSHGSTNLMLISGPKLDKHSKEFKPQDHGFSLDRPSYLPHTFYQKKKCANMDLTNVPSYVRIRKNNTRKLLASGRTIEQQI